MMSTDSLVSTIDIAERNPKIGEALNYYQRGNWFNLFKAWETVKEGTEGHSNSWTSAKLRRRFTSTVNDPKAIGDEARHSVNTGDSTSKPMSVEEAREYVRGLISRWIDEERI